MLKLPDLTELHQLCEYTLFSLTIYFDIALRISVALPRKYAIITTRLLLMAELVCLALDTLRNFCC